MLQQKNERELLCEQFELVSANLKSIIMLRTEQMNSQEREMLLNVIKKVVFIRESFDFNSPKFPKLVQSLQLQSHRANEAVFRKGDRGEYFYIVLEGSYCVQRENAKERRRQQNIFYYPGDSFGEVSLIYDVPRGATIIACKDSSLIRIPKDVFNDCGDLQKSICYLNTFFEGHPFFEKEDKFMIRVVSSLSKLVRFGDKQLVCDENQVFNSILFFVKGQVNIYKQLMIEKRGVVFEQTIQIAKLSGGDVFGEKFYLTKQRCGVKIVSVHRGELIKVSFKDNINTVETPLYKRIRQNAESHPTDEQYFEQYKMFLQQKAKQLQFIKKLYNDDEAVNKELKDVKGKINKIKDAKVVAK